MCWRPHHWSWAASENRTGRVRALTVRSIVIDSSTPQVVSQEVVLNHFFGSFLELTNDALMILQNDVWAPVERLQLVRFSHLSIQVPSGICDFAAAILIFLLTLDKSRATNRFATTSRCKAPISAKRWSLLWRSDTLSPLLASLLPPPTLRRVPLSTFRHCSWLPQPHKRSTALESIFHAAFALEIFGGNDCRFNWRFLS